jgi:uncharacterized YigZ family protein
MAKDTYLTLETIPEPAVFKDRKSKFIAYAFPVQHISDVKNHIEILKKEHHSARHWCYAYRIGIENIDERANDDGEPSNSAGMPILNQIKTYHLTNILVVVVRYFGGVKLGVGGLINAYKTATQMVLEQAQIVEKIRKNFLRIVFDYNDMNKVMRIVKENKLEIVQQNLSEQGEIILAVRLDDFDDIFQRLQKIHTLKVTQID